MHEERSENENFSANVDLNHGWFLGVSIVARHKFVEKGACRGKGG